MESSKPKKQRKAHYSRALHSKQKGLAAHLDSKLRKELGRRSAPLRKSDSVKVLRGSNRGKSGKVTAVNYGKGVVFVDKIVRKKANGEEIPRPVQASNLLVVDLDRSDAKRFKRKVKGKGSRAEGKEEKAAGQGKGEEKAAPEKAAGKVSAKETG